MKKYLIFAAAALMALSACTDETYVDRSVVDKQNQPVPMEFNVHVKNQSRAEIPAGALQNYKKEFGVWAYKSTASDAVMTNFLVGFNAPNATAPVAGAKGYKGYYSASTNNISETLDDSDNLTDHKSRWFYDGLGSSQYTADDLTIPEGYITKEVYNTNPSANTAQELKYWDPSSNYYDFYAYIPYSASTTLSTDKKLTFPLYTASSTTDGSGENVNLVASKKVSKSSGSYTYNDVDLSFKRLNGKVRLAFYEDLAGYAVEITSAVVATPTDIDPSDPTKYIDGHIAVKGTPVYDFANNKAAWTYVNTAGEENYSYSGEALTFAKPAGTATTIPATTGSSYNVIATSKDDAIATSSTSLSATNYYCVPANPASTTTGEGSSAVTTLNYPNSGLMFKFSFKAISTDTNDVIEYTDQKVFVPYTNNQWVGNTLYTYIFKITSSTMHPIVFDGITISDYSSTEVVSDFAVD